MDEWLDRGLKILVSIACIWFIAGLTFCSPVTLRSSFSPTFSPVIKTPPAIVTVVGGGPAIGSRVPVLPPAAPSVWPLWSLVFLIVATLIAVGLTLFVLERMKVEQSVFGKGPESNVNRMATVSVLVAAALPQLSEALGELKYIITFAGGALALAPLVLRLFGQWWWRLTAAVVIVAVFAAISTLMLSRSYHKLNVKHEWNPEIWQTGWAWLRETAANIQPDAAISIWVILAFLVVNVAVAIWTGKGASVT